MDYYGLNFTIESDIQTEIIIDILFSELGEIGFESFEEKENSLYAYIPAEQYNKEELDEKLASFPLDHVNFNYTAELIKAKNWNEEWEKNYFQPIKIDDKCIIRASFHPDEPGFKHMILIDPKMAFGTGNHETTRLMINQLLKTEMSGKSILDMGCGTAVLAILARKQDAGKVVAVDIDEWAYQNALENIKLNHVAEIEVRHGGVDQIKENEHFDLIIANINRNILLNDIQHYASAMQFGAKIFMSGFYTEDIPLLEAEAKKHGLKLIAQNESNRWAMIVCSKEN